MNSAVIKRVGARVDRVDRNDDDPGCNWLVKLTVPGAAIGLVVAAFADQQSADHHADELATMNGWTRWRAKELSTYEAQMFVLDEAIRGELLTRGLSFGAADDLTKTFVTIVREHLPPASVAP